MTFISGGSACMYVPLSCLITSFGSLFPTTTIHSGFKFSQLEMSESTKFYAYENLLWVTLCYTEVVLATLLATFKFERSNVPVVWNFAGIPFPAKSRESTIPEMYMKVSLAE